LENRGYRPTARWVEKQLRMFLAKNIRNASYIIGKTVKTVKIRSSCRAGITGINNRIVKRRKKGKLGFIQSLYSAAKR